MVERINNIPPTFSVFKDNKLLVNYPEESLQWTSNMDSLKNSDQEKTTKPNWLHRALLNLPSRKLLNDELQLL